MEEEEKIRAIYQELLEKYGEPDQPDGMSGIDYLIETILSQNTNDINRDKAFRNLKDKYGDDYEAIENADREELIETIRIAGLGPTKAERIQEALRIVREDQGEYSIDFLEDMSVDEAKKWLTDIPGIGPKTASVILCFHFGMPTFPVDTHVHRLSKRLGLVPENASRTKTHNIMEEKVPDEIKYPFHILLITHGRNGCTAHDESCELCEKYREK
jgi:endonuclease-3